MSNVVDGLVVWNPCGRSGPGLGFVVWYSCGRSGPG